ncbi:MAG: beta-N-acetylhexosaminidase [Alphaproteobacteria bacterium]
MIEHSAVIFGMEGQALTADERAFFKDVDPWGYILFARNCDTPDQIRALTDSLRDLAGRELLPILIDQEGGRVQRLRPPHWRNAPPAQIFASAFAQDHEAAIRACYMNARLIGADLQGLGITVDCAPVLDWPQQGAHDIIGDRAHGADLESISTLGQAVMDGLLASGVLPIIKHIPGHGRAIADSHEDLPVVDTARAALAATDFAPFKALNAAPMAMTAHVVYAAIDDTALATTSRTVIADVMRGHIGFDGLLMSDDLSMKALKGSFADRTKASLSAGCDVVLHCNGDMAEMQAIASATPVLDGKALNRAKAALDLLQPPLPLDKAEALEALAVLERKVA